MRDLIHLLYKTATGGRKYYKTVSEEQWKSEKTLSQIEKTRLEDIILHSYNSTTYYKPLLKDAGVVDSKGKIYLENYGNLPILDKNLIRENFEALKSKNIKDRKWIYKTTGGSTGEPLKVIHDLERVKWVDAAKDVCNDWTGIRFSERKIRLWGSERDLFYGKETYKVRFNRFVNNAIWLNAFKMTPTQMRQYADQINDFKPLLIKGYANCLFEFSVFLSNNGIDVHSPRSVISSAGTLTPLMRRKIEKVFKSKVFDSYGSREIQAMAFECPTHAGLHVLGSHLYLEIVSKNGHPAQPGELGEIIMTPYFNYAMPLLRYRIGDMGVMSKEKCSCGRGWPLMESVSGRVTECFYKRDGGVVPPEYFIHLVGVVLNDGWISKFQVIQEDYDSIIVKLVCSEKTLDPHLVYSSQLSALNEKIKLVMSEDCKVRFVFVGDIETSRSGKYLYTVSKIHNLNS